MIKLTEHWHRYKTRIKLCIATAGAVLLSFSMALPVYAAIDPPDLDQNILAVWVYHHCLETNDQLYLIDYVIDYTTNPPGVGVTEAFLCRLLNGTDELRAVAPYNFFDDGYNRGVIAIYFPATPAPPTWEGGYTMQLVGNPALDWVGGVPPLVQVTTFDNWSVSDSINITQNELAAKILYLAQVLENTWGIDMIDASGLTSYGESYFTNVIPNARLIAPGAFAVQILQPTYPTHTYTQTYATGLAGDVAGTPLDIEPVATAAGISPAWLTAILYFGAVALLLGRVTYKSQSYKPIIILSVPAIIGGALLGLIPLVVAIMVGFAALVMTIYVLFLQKSSA